MKKHYESQADRIADQIASALHDENIVFLPPMRVLAQRYKVSLSTIYKAIGRLKARKLVTSYRGGRVRVAGRDEPTQPLLPREKKPSRDEQLYRETKENIANGTYQRGFPLPKVGYLSLVHSVSHHAITKVYRRLEQENLAHKKGRTWIAGPRLVRLTGDQSPNQPVILLLQSTENFWAEMAQRPFFETFCRSFQTETENFNVELRPAVYERRDSSVGIIPAGREAIASLIRGLGQRYRGSLMVNAEKEIPSLRTWISDLLRFQKPVVWFDRLKENPGFRFSTRYFARCHEAEEYAVSLALEYLFELGHRRIAFPGLSNASWVNRRRSIVNRVASRIGFKQVDNGDPENILFDTEDYQRQAQYLRRLYESGVPYIKTAINFISSTASSLFESLPPECDAAFREDRFLGAARLTTYLARNEEKTSALLTEFKYLPWLIAVTPVLGPILAKGDVTAVLAPNDFTARRYYFWLKANDVSVPQDISLASFDNLWFLQHVPVTSVDFGYGYLGFAAFHSIIQDVSLKVDRHGNIPAQPRVVHRGTVASAEGTYDPRRFNHVFSPSD